MAGRGGPGMLRHVLLFVLPLASSLECIAERAFDAPTRGRCNSHAGDYGPPLPSLLPLDATRGGAEGGADADGGGAAPATEHPEVPVNFRVPLAGDR